ncbi:MAG: hypothetical protein ACLQJR_08545 [Stellaceae bacterium]
MNSSLSRWAATAFVIGLVAVLSSGCIVAGGGYGYDGGAGYGLDYYEPYGVGIGGWGPDYQVAPYREGEHRPASVGGRPAAHAYRAAPASRAMPSIPSGSRSGGGGGRGGGGGGHR